MVQLLDRRSSYGQPIIITEHTAESLTPPDLPVAGVIAWWRLNQSVVQTVMVSLAMVVHQEYGIEVEDRREVTRERPCTVNRAQGPGRLLLLVRLRRRWLVAERLGAREIGRARAHLR